MIPKDMILLNLKRNDLDYYTKAREALINADEALKRKDVAFARQLINEFVFSSHLLNSTQELQLICILLNDFFIRDDTSKLGLFFNIFEIGKNSRKFVLLKFIISAIAIGNGPALNAAGKYLLDTQMKEVRVSADLNRLLINEITFFSSNSLDKLKILPLLSPLFTNALCLIFAETFKDDQLPTRVLAELVTEFLNFTPSPFIFCFSIPSHVETGAFLIGSFFRWSVLSELFDEQPYSYSKLHLKILNEMSNVEVTAKPLVYTKYLEVIIEQIQKSLVKIKDPERVQRSVEKLAQLIQVSKNYLYGNIPMLMDKLKMLPKNPILDLVISMK